jgi:3-phenylpropionate/trans-cinnamate dioxygenase ferredoxin subunit
MPKWITVAAKSDVPADGCKAVEVSEVAVVLINKGDEITALRNVCSHMDYPLHEGDIDDDTIMCPLHGAKFDIKTGEVRAMPAAKGVSVFQVNIDGDNVQLDEEELANF